MLSPAAIAAAIILRRIKVFPCISRPHHILKAKPSRALILINAPNIAVEAAAERAAANNLLRHWQVSKRVNSSRADAEDATLIEPLA
jgi:hypothetical protein